MFKTRLKLWLGLLIDLDAINDVETCKQQKSVARRKGADRGLIHLAWETAQLDRESFQGWLLKWKSNRPLSEGM